MTDNQDKPKRRQNMSQAEWEALHDEWYIGNMTKKAFLESKGICPTNGNVRKIVTQWQRDDSDEYRGLRANREALKALDAEKVPSSSLKLEKPSDVMALINRWRISQSHNDYKIAESLRNHIKLLLNDALIKVKDRNGSYVKDANGNQRYKSGLSASAVRSLSTSLETLQRVQRLALGMSTENIGIEGEIIGGEVLAKDKAPIFEVQMNKDGKFENARPVRIREQ